MIEPLQQAEFNAQRLLTEHPPVWCHPSKRLVFEIACPAGSTSHGIIRYSRWAPRKLPARIAWPPPHDLVLPRPDFYDYQPCGGAAPSMEWHVNFADPHLFVAYGSSLLAQDEM